MSAVGRLALEAEPSRSIDEQELLDVYRDALLHDRTVLFALLDRWEKLGPGNRGLVYRVADALVSAKSWKPEPETVVEVPVSQYRKLAEMMGAEAVREKGGTR